MLGGRIPLAILLVGALVHSALAGPRQRLIVAYRSLDACVHCLLADRVPFATVTGDDGLDRLNTTLHVRSATPLALPRRDLGGSGRSAAYARALADTRDRFPLRSARAPLGATAPDLSNIYVLELDGDLDDAEAATLYAHDAHVAWAEPDRRLRVSFTPNDPYFGTAGAWGQAYGNLWGIELTHAATAWDTVRGTGTIVAVVDTGVDPTHADLAANMWTNSGEVPDNGIDDDGNGFVDDVRGWDFQRGDNDPTDDNGHGTHVAGTIAAVGNNGIGVVGMAFGARIMAIKGIGSDGIGFTSDLASAMLYAIDNGADVINASWGGPGIDPLISAAVDTATAAGVVVVAASGNGATDVAGQTPAGIPGVIAVGAIDHTGAVASFSNGGEGLAVTAPGVDVLSLRAAQSGPVGGSVVGGSYLRLTGTSMASPHAAGLAALLLSGQPTFGTDDVAWHLELNAAQPGLPGWEGQRWNPAYGFGIIDAAHVFDVPPATTRIRNAVRVGHVRVNTVIPAVQTVDFGFTTHDPVAWMLSGIPWLTPSVTSGVGDASVPLDLDTTGLAPGTYTGSIAIDAPATVDGGALTSATVYTHADVRAGGSSVLGTDPANFNYDPAIGSDGVGTLAFWGSQSGFTPTLEAARLDGAGNALTVAPIVTGWPWKRRVASAFDGRNHLVVWLEQDTHTASGHTTGTIYVKAMRVAADGQPVDSTPIVVMERPYTPTREVWPVRVAFDGVAYTVLWSEVTAGPSYAYVRRIGIDGTLRDKARRVYPTPGTDDPQFTLPDLKCAPLAGTCLVAWLERDFETDATGKYIDKVYGIRLSGDRAIDTVPRLLLRDGGYELVVGSDGASGYLVAVARTLLCPGPVLCGRDVVASRVAADGTSLDPDGIRLTQGLPAGFVADARVTSVVFDGDAWLALWYHNESVTGLHWHGVHVAPDGTVPDDEHEGLLLDPSPLALSAVLAPTRSHVQMVGLNLAQWGDTTLTPMAQRVLPRVPPTALPEHAIGTIGPQTVAERGLLAFVVTAPSLGAGATFSATNLPEGAVFDAATAAFRWMPGPDQAGAYPSVAFTASDGTTTLAETVAITVTEAKLTLGGTVRLGDGTPVAGAAVRARTAGGKWTAFSDAEGRYRFTDLTPRAFAVKLDKPTKRSYLATPRVGHATLGASDRLDIDLVLTPK